MPTNLHFPVSLYSDIFYLRSVLMHMQQWTKLKTWDILSELPEH